MVDYVFREFNSPLGMRKVLLTGFTPNGYLHLGNYLGALKPMLLPYDADVQANFIIIADYHSFTKNISAAERSHYAQHMLAACLSFSTSTHPLIVFRQSDIPEIAELHLILSSLMPMSYLKRCHAYKALQTEKINVSLLTYPVLMAADILAFHTAMVPVGKDQMQHLEITKYCAQTFNRIYGTACLQSPIALHNASDTLQGTDGRKMSKSYHNTIPLFSDPAQLKKIIFAVTTTSQGIGEPKDYHRCLLFHIYQHFAPHTEVISMQQRYLKGISWKEVKEELCHLITNLFTSTSIQYQNYLQHPETMTEPLARGTRQARAIAQKTLSEVKAIVGLL
jgi:tryptophanyl-tRNA synthetase